MEPWFQCVEKRAEFVVAQGFEGPDLLLAGEFVLQQDARFQPWPVLVAAPGEFEFCFFRRHGRLAAKERRERKEDLFQPCPGDGEVVFEMIV